MRRDVPAPRASGRPCPEQSAPGGATGWGGSGSEADLFLRVEIRLVELEARIGLLSSFQPLDGSRERARVAGLLARPGPGGRPPAGFVPRLRYAAPRNGERLAAQLDSCQLILEQLGPSWRRECLEARTAELRLELQLTRYRGEGCVPELARRRFLTPELAAELSAAASLAHEVLGRARLRGRRTTKPDSGSVRPRAAYEPRVDLAVALEELLRRAGLCIPILSADIASRAAVSREGLLVRRSETVSEAEVVRLFVHEVYGHWLPRRAAATRREVPFAIGPVGADRDEEGYAVFLEERHAALSERRLEVLALRHVLAERVIQGADAADAMLELLRGGASAEDLADAACRVLRGGGLCREIIYLPGLLRIRRAAAEPNLINVLAQGRATVEAARVWLAEGNVPQERPIPFCSSAPQLSSKLPPGE